MISEAAIGKLVVIGAGGHAKVVLEAIWASGIGEVVGLIDPGVQAPVLGVRVLGGDEALPGLRSHGVARAVVALGANITRAKVAAQMLALGFELPVIVHPSAIVSPSATLGAGSIIMAGAVVGTMVFLGELAIVNTGAIIDHDGRLGTAAHVAPGCALAGNVSVGARALVGVGSSVRPGVKIGVDAVVGAGSAVVADVPDNATVAGVPARRLDAGSAR